MTIDRLSPDLLSVNQARAVVATEVRALARSPDPAGASWQRLRDALVSLATMEGSVPLDAGRRIELQTIAQSRGIHTIEETRGQLGHEASLVPDRLGFRLRVREGSFPPRKRASIAHEIGHSHFFDTSRLPPTRLIARSPDPGVSVKEEELCWAYARALLMPADHVERAWESRGITAWATIEAIGEDFEVSTELAARRLIQDLDVQPNCVAFFFATQVEPGASEREAKRYAGSRVRDLFTRPEFKASVSMIEAALEDKAPQGELDLAARRSGLWSVIDVRQRHVMERYLASVLLSAAEDLPPTLGL